MAKAHSPTDTLTIDVRTTSGTTAARAVRRAGQIPGVLYGHGEPTSIAIGVKALEDLLTMGGKSHILDASIAGSHDSVLLRDVQRDPVSHRPIHADFQRVTKGEAILASVPIVLVGNSTAVKDDNAVLDTVTREIDVKGPAGNLPENITIDVTSLAVNTHVNAGDLVLPAGFTLITPADTVILTIEPSRTAELAEEVAPVPVATDAPADAEPAATT